jgi:putative transposase
VSFQQLKKIKLGWRYHVYPNTVMESFYRTLKRELVQDANYDNPEQAKMGIFKYIETYYNTNRIHSALGWLSLAQFELQNS